MDDELEIISGLDQPLIVDYAQELQQVEDSINEAIHAKDLEDALVVCAEYISKMKLSGLALAKALYMLVNAWNEFGIEDDVYDTLSSYLGIHRHTVERYERVYTMLVYYVPEGMKEEIQQKNIKALIPIANAIAQGYEIEENVWQELADAPDYNTVSKIVNNVRGKETGRTSLQITMDRDGSLWVWANDESAFIGSLEVKDKDDLVKRAINRIVNNAGIIEK